MANEIEGFPNVNISSEATNGGDELQKKEKVGNKKSGGFQSMSLCFPVLKGIQKRGYKVPTPIQRKTIPVVLEGHDVVAMARTGSGKTACFLIPLFEKLKSHGAKDGARALILSPTRELALQTLKFIKELGRFMDLKSAVILGGDSMDDQFTALHGNPDIIVATPGRFLHICIEMDLKLKSVEYVVFDEADRLFEMGFGEQLREITTRLPDSRQTLLFSATLPKVLVEFTRAGLSNPTLIRLDVESKLPEKLQLSFLFCRSEEKVAALLCLLKQIMERKSQTLIFAATKHHVEYLHMILEKSNITNTYIYSNLDPSARKINAAKFQVGKVSVLIVTDIAARGIDIPQLDYVVNYNFPSKPKLFVHRVGRCARAGRSGVAYSLVSSDEYPYLLDLHLFLSRPLSMEADDGSVGVLPQSFVEEEQSELLLWHNQGSDMANMKRVCDNAYKQYIRSRPGASVDSVRRAKELNITKVKLHPMFVSNEKTNCDKISFLKQMKNYRPNGTIFELGQASTSTVYTVMKQAREKHRKSIASHKRKMEENQEKENLGTSSSLAESTAEDIDKAFQHVIEPKKYQQGNAYEPKKKKKKVIIDEEHYIPYTAPDHHTELGLSVNSFHSQASKLQLDLTGDSEDMLKMQRQLMHWDRKKKKMVAVNKETKVGKIRSESGAWIPASYKTNRYLQWKQKTKVEENESDSEDSEGGGKGKPAFHHRPHTHWGRHNENVRKKKIKNELRKPEQILKLRIQKEKRKERQNRRLNKKRKHTK